jgi:predicted  nucleic acid-binding Zn-ribbon protein
MEPEISHRCPSCGASIRSHAQFCPQCGKVLKSSASGAFPASESSDSLRRLRAERDLKTTRLPPISKAMEPTQALAPNAEEKAVPDASDGHQESSQPVVAVQDESLSKRQRVKEAALGVKENMRPRVEKLRQASSVMLEEASAIDPSLRFIIIAILLFIIFVIMLFLSFIK